ncbi:MAG: hypothetical protein Q7K43_06530, partial [Candidatus Woesearchaeota archaeon]|nr:hypothetical protein [Candidatus Woesearchaeota archaeon]
FSEEKTIPIKFDELSDELMCGQQSLSNFTAESLLRNVSFFDVTEILSSSSASLKVTLEKRTLSIEKDRITVLGGETGITLEASSLNKSIPLPSNPLLNIVGVPLQISVQDSAQDSVQEISKEVLASVSLSFVPNYLLDSSSLGVYVYSGSEWKYQGGVINGSEVIANISIVPAKPVIVSIMGISCESCVKSEFVKKYAGKSRVAVIFVHGLTSRASKWKYLLDEFIYTNQPAQFWMFNYPVSQKTEENAKAFIDLLENKQSEFDSIYFVGHSLGGFVVESALAQASVAHEKNSAEYTFLNKVRTVIIIGAPHEGSPSAEAYLNLFSFFANKPDVVPVINANSAVVQEVTRGMTFTRVPEIKYVVLAGTKTYSFNAGLFEVSANKLVSGANDGITNVSGARRIGNSELTDFCSNYYELNVTHTELDDHPLARRVIKYVLSQDIAQQLSQQMSSNQALLGANKYVSLHVKNCSREDSYALIGKRVNANAIPSVLGCKCGNKVCGVDENETVCPVDCSRSLFSEEEAFVKQMVNYFLMILLILFGLTFWYCYRNKKQVLLITSAVCFVLSILSFVLINIIS